MTGPVARGERPQRPSQNGRHHSGCNQDQHQYHHNHNHKIQHEQHQHHHCRRYPMAVVAAAGLLVAATCALAHLAAARPLGEMDPSSQSHQLAVGSSKLNEQDERLLAGLNESLSRFLQAGERQQQERVAADGPAAAAATTTTRANSNSGKGQQQQQIVALKKISCDKLSLVVMAQRALNVSASSGAIRRLAECRQENLLDLELWEMFERSASGQVKPAQQQLTTTMTTSSSAAAAAAKSDMNQAESNDNHTKLAQNHHLNQQQQQRDRATVRQQAPECAPGQDRSGGACTVRVTMSPQQQASQTQPLEQSHWGGLHFGAKLAICLLLAGLVLVSIATCVDVSDDKHGGHMMREAGVAITVSNCQPTKQKRDARFFLDLGPAQAPKLRDYRSLSISSNCSSNLFCSSTNSVASSSAPILASSQPNVSHQHHHHQAVTTNTSAHHPHHHNQQHQQHLAPSCCNHYESNLQLHLSCQAREQQQQQQHSSLEQAATGSNCNKPNNNNDTGATLSSTGFARQILLAFSLRQTLGQIFEKQQPSEQHQQKSVDSLHGLRFFSMIWVIVIHSYNFALRWMFFSNTSTLDGIYKSTASQFIANGSFACDSFFFVGGFLLPYLALRPPSSSTLDEQDKLNDNINEEPQKRHQDQQQVSVMVSNGDRNAEEELSGDEVDEMEEATPAASALAPSHSASVAAGRTGCCCWRICNNLTGSRRHISNMLVCKQKPQLVATPNSGDTCCHLASQSFVCHCQADGVSPLRLSVPLAQTVGPLDQLNEATTSDLDNNNCTCPSELNSLCKRRLVPNTNELASSNSNLAGAYLKESAETPTGLPNGQHVHNMQVQNCTAPATHHYATEDLIQSQGKTSAIKTMKHGCRQVGSKQRPMAPSSAKNSDGGNSSHLFTWQRCLANVVRRYVRMMPLMMAIIGLCTSLLRYLGDGPVWQESTMMYDDWCRRNWWVNAMFLHNFVNRENMCLSHSWYSAVDFQLFLVGQLLLYVIYRNRRLGLTLLFGLLFASPLVTMVLTLKHHLPAVPLIASVNEQTMNLYYGEIYIKPYSRASPYLIGILLAYLMRTTKLSQWRLKKWQVFVAWTLAISLLLAIILAMQPAMNGHTPGELESALYSGWSRPLWACATGWIIFACITKQAGPIGRILGARCFVPLSRLTYPAFLIHPIIMASFYGTRQASFQFSHYLMLYLILGNIVITYASAFVLAALIELPFLSIERLISGRLFINGNK